MTLLTIYVPATDDLHGILPGSAIVGADPFMDGNVNDRASYIRVDYEGGKFNQEYYADVNHRLLHAAGRHTWGATGYPTTARSWLPESELHAVGEYDTDLWAISQITDQAAFDAWNARWNEAPPPTETHVIEDAMLDLGLGVVVFHEREVE